MATTAAHCVIECSDQPLDISFHLTNPNIIAAGLVDGTVEVHNFEGLLESRPALSEASKNQTDDDDDVDEVDTIVSSTPVHTQLLMSKSSDSGVRKAVCRAVQFSMDGTTLYTGGSAGDLVGLDAARITTFDASSVTSKKSATKWRCNNACYGKGGVQVIHEFQQSQGQNNPNEFALGEESNVAHFRSLLATGDEAGGVRIWDSRLLSQQNNHNNPNETSSLKKPPGCIYSWKLHEDYISGIANSDDGYTLLVSSADCTISAYDLRMAAQQNQPLEKVTRRSDDQEDELLSIQIMKNGRKVVCGTGEGVLSIFSWGTWGDVSDRFPGHPASVDALLQVDQDTLLTGSSDGLIRVVQIHPNKLLGILGDHEGFPIEKLKFNANQNFVGSVTHDCMIRIWDARILQDEYDHEIDQQENDVDTSLLAGKNDKQTSMAATNNGNSDDDWDDMDEDMEDDSNSDDSDDKSSSAPSATKNDRRKNRLKSEREKFYEDL